MDSGDLARRGAFVLSAVRRLEFTEHPIGHRHSECRRRRTYVRRNRDDRNKRQNTHVHDVTAGQVSDVT